MHFLSPRRVAEKVEVKPPSYNMGAVDTLIALTIAPDWFSLTFPARVDLAIIRKELKRQFPSNECVELPFGGKGYPSQAQYGPARLFYGGPSDMGHHVQFPGQAIRECRDLHDFLAFAYESGASASRFDIACDDKEAKILDISRLIETSEKGAQLGSFRAIEPKKKFSNKCELIAHGVNFGSRQSEIFCRVYDKSLEQNAKSKDAVLPAGSWLRMEFELKGKNATQAFFSYVESNFKNLSAIFGGYVSRYLSFRVPSSDSNRSRWAVAPWWSSFLESIPKASIIIERVKTSLLKKALWFQTSCSKSLAILMRSPSFGKVWLSSLLHDRTLRLTPADIHMSLEDPFSGVLCES